MFPQFASFLFLAILPLATHGAEVYKWIDENGRVHYGDSIPEKSNKKAAVVQKKGGSPTEAQRQQAEARAAKGKADADVMRTQRETPIRVPPPASPTATARVGDKAHDCQAQKQAYREAQACFAPYKNKNGSTKSEAFQYCPTIAEPLCE